MMRRPGAIVVLLSLSLFPCLAQQRQRVPVCSQTTSAVFRSLPELSYQCPQRFSESDEEILKVPERIAALHKLAEELESFTDAAWWQA